MPTTRHLINGEAHLSISQKEILLYVWRETSRREKVFKARGDHNLLARLQYWGIEWYPSLVFQWGYEPWSPTDRAVCSRSLRRLEQRGLVERKNERTGASRRTTNVRLTGRGRKIAKQIRFRE
jgi:hypothetical protein